MILDVDCAPYWFFFLIFLLFCSCVAFHVISKKRLLIVGRHLRQPKALCDKGILFVPFRFGRRDCYQITVDSLCLKINSMISQIHSSIKLTTEHTQHSIKILKSVKLP